MGSSKIYKAFRIGSLALFVTSVFLPWLTEHRATMIGGRISSQFWSYQMVINISYLGRQADLITLTFHEYWQPSPEYAYPLNIYLGWFFVFAFQMGGIAAGAIGLVKEKVRGRYLPMVLTTAFLVLSLILGGFQLFWQMEAGRSYLGHMSAPTLDVGFFLAMISTILWTVPLLLGTLTKRTQEVARASVITTLRSLSTKRLRSSSKA